MELPPGGPVLLLAHDLAAALEAGDERRAYEAACALSQAAGVLVEVCEPEEAYPWSEAVHAARERVGLNKPEKRRWIP